MTPILGAIMCLVLLMSLMDGEKTRNFFLIYLAVGIVIYFVFGIWNSKLGKGEPSSPATRPRPWSCRTPIEVAGQTWNCSASILSSRLRPASNRTDKEIERSSVTSTRMTSRTSTLSATALTGRLSLSRISNVTWALCEIRAPRQRLGRKALIGVTGEDTGVNRDDRPVGGEIVGGRSGWC